MDKRLKKLEEFRTVNKLGHSDIARMLKLEHEQTYNNWRYRNSVPKQYYEAVDLLVGPNAGLGAELIAKIDRLNEPGKKLAIMYLDALLSEQREER